MFKLKQRPEWAQRQMHFYLQMGIQRRDKSVVMMMIIIAER
jgi:hypothetical protein